MLNYCDFANVQERAKMMKFEYFLSFIENQQVNDSITINQPLLIFKSVCLRLFLKHFGIGFVQTVGIRMIGYIWEQQTH